LGKENHGSFDATELDMYAYAAFVAALTTIAVVSFGFDAMAGSKSHGGFETVAESKKCKEGHVYSETEKKCIPKPGPARPDKS
jgi:hypothetical protein